MKHPLLILFLSHPCPSRVASRHWRRENGGVETEGFDGAKGNTHSQPRRVWKTSTAGSAAPAKLSLPSSTFWAVWVAGALVSLEECVRDKLGASQVWK